VQRRQTGTKIGLLISLILHLAVVLVLRDTVINTRTHRRTDSLYADLVSLPDSAISKPYIPKRTYEPIRRSQRTPAETLPGRFSADKLPPRAVVSQRSNEKVNKSEIPMLDTSVPAEQYSPNALSSTASATGASSQGRGVGERAGSGRGGGGSGGLVSVSPRRVPIEDRSIDDKLQVYGEADLPFIKALQEIGQHVVDVRQSRKVDIVFIIDTSNSMQNDIDAVRKHLNRMIQRLKTASLDFNLGVVRFHHSAVYEWLGMDITISDLTSDVEDVKETLKSIRVSGGERALDALMKAISEVKFRKGADRHFILVTDEYVKGTYPVTEVLRAAKRDKITIDVLGRDEPFQRTIAEQTGGIWTSIDKIK